MAHEDFEDMKKVTVRIPECMYLRINELCEEKQSISGFIRSAIQNYMIDIINEKAKKMNEIVLEEKRKKREG